MKLPPVGNVCSGCGTCAGICPHSVIEMHRNCQGIYLPTVKDLEKCRECGLCLKVCPNISLDMIKLDRLIFGSSPNNVLLGNFINCYVGHSTDEMIRNRSASGGLATALIAFALERKMIDGAIVTRMSRVNPLEPEVFISRSREETISAAKSKYCPVPLNIALKNISNQDGKFAVVGLPCHIQGIRKAEMIQKELKNKIVLHIGLFCSHTVNFLGTEFLLQRMNVKVNEVINLDYRGEGWPGGMTVTLRDGKKMFLPSSFYWRYFFSPYFFTPIHCTLCQDQTNELADISIGDAWLPELMKHNDAESIIMTRSDVGDKLLKKVTQSGKIKIKKTNDNEVLQSQKLQLAFKKGGLIARISVLKSLGIQVPESSTRSFKSKPISYVAAILTYLNIYLSSKQAFRRMLKHIPLTILKLYSDMFNKIKSQYIDKRGDILDGNRLEKNILIFGGGFNLKNKGTATVVNSLLAIVRELSPQATLTILSMWPEIGSKRCAAIVSDYLFPSSLTSSNRITRFAKTTYLLASPMLWAILRRTLGITSYALVQSKRRKTLEAYTEADHIIVCGTDVISDCYGIDSYIMVLIHIWTAILLGKPIAIYSTQIGPFRDNLKGEILTFLTRITLNKVDLITVRDPISMQYLQKIGVKNPSVHLGADTAFLLQPIAREKVEEIMQKKGITGCRKPLVGINVSALAYQYGFSNCRSLEAKLHAYINLMSKVINHLIEKLNVTVILIPHVYGPGENDDRIIAKKIYRFMSASTRKKVKIITAEYTPEVLKGIIGQLDFFIAARMHSLIHAISMCIPSVGIDYTFKIKALMSTAGQEKWVCDIETNYDELVSKIYNAFLLRNEIKKELILTTRIIKNRATSSAELLKAFLSA